MNHTTLSRRSEAEVLTFALGGRWSGGFGLAPCPAHEDHEPSLSLREGEGGKLLLKCFAGCSFSELLEALRRRGLLAGFSRFGAGAVLPPLPDHEQVSARKARQALSIWEATEPLPASPAEAYLRRRGISCVLPLTLRFHPACPHPGGGRFPALVGRVDGGEGFAIHRTFLRPDGSGKAELQPQKAMLGAVAGGALRLASGAEALAVAEGLETALSLRSGLLKEDAAIWAALSASSLKGLRLPLARGRKLIIATDGDRAGREAGEILAERADAEGWRVFLLPAPEGLDWNDLLRERSLKP